VTDHGRYLIAGRWWGYGPGNVPPDASTQLRAVLVRVAGA
jgi:hypothetical protein